MFISIFSDELALDITEGLPIIKSWGLEYADLRGRVFGKAAENLGLDEMKELRKLFDDHGMKAGCLQSSLAKVHLPDKERQAEEAQKLERLIQLAEIMDCPWVRAFHYWQPKGEDKGQLDIRPDEFQKVMDMFGPLADRAKEAGLMVGFENCGVLPDEVFAVLDALNIPQWGLAWDVNNTWDCEEREKDEDAFIARMVKRSKMIHVKAKGVIDGLADYTIPYDKVLNYCSNAGVPGSVSAETHNPDRSKDNVEMSRQVVQAIQRAWPTAAPGGFEGPKKKQFRVSRPWEDDPVRFLVVGLGMGHVRAKGIANTPGTKLVGVCDINEERAKRTSEELGVPYKTDVRDWLDKDEVEAVFVLTETGNHGKVAMQALEAGKHVMTTKPMDANVANCDAMIRLADEKGLQLAVDFNRRSMLDVLELKAAIEKQRLGKLLGGSCLVRILRTDGYFQENGGWRGTFELDGGGVMSNQSVHEIDELVYCLGVPKRVCCKTYTLNHKIEAEDMASATWEYENGLVLTYQATTNYPQPTWYRNIELFGVEGCYHHIAAGPFDEAITKWYQDGAWSEKAPEKVEQQWMNSMDNFAAALRDGAKLLCSGRDGRRSRAVIDAMYESSLQHDGGWVEVKPDFAG
ncbi:MAG: Gfo/Idh/MocA family oxidoreductase [Candidatus Sumerlaeia bacterium]